MAQKDYLEASKIYMTMGKKKEAHQALLLSNDVDRIITFTSMLIYIA